MYHFTIINMCHFSKSNWGTLWDYHLSPPHWGGGGGDSVFLPIFRPNQ